MDRCPLTVPTPSKCNAYYNPKCWKLNTVIGIFQQVYSGTPLSSYISVWGAPVFVEGRGKFVNVTRDPTTGNWVAGQRLRPPHADVHPDRCEPLAGLPRQQDE